MPGDCAAMRMGLSFQVVAIALLLLLAASPVMTVYGQAAGQINPDTSSKELEKLRLRAYILQKTLGRAANIANVSESLRSEIEALASMNVSALSEEGLKTFNAEAEALLVKIKESFSRCNATLSQERVALSLLERIKERLNMTLMRMNLTSGEAEQVREWIRERAGENLTVRDVAHLMKNVREMLRHRWAAMLSEEAMNYSERAAGSGAIFGLMNALNASSKVLEVLENVKMRLIEGNASERAVEAIEHNIERIAAAREVLKQLIEKMSAGHPPGNAARERAREELGSIVRERTGKLNETIEEYLNKLQELKDEALKLNLKDLAEEIEKEIAELEALKGKIASGNLSLSELADAAASAKELIQHAEKLIERASEKMEKQGPERAIKMIDECISRLQELREGALKMNLTDLAREINATITSLRTLRDRIASGELNLKELTDTIASAEGVIKHAEEAIEKAIPHRGGEKVMPTPPTTPPTPPMPLPPMPPGRGR
jgi:hypothetical protein